MAEHRRTSGEFKAARRIAFGEYQFDCEAGELRRGNEEIKLTPRASALLAALAERSTEIVSKRELIDRLWGGKAVGDDALTSCVQELRRALGDPPRNPRFVETRHRRGYRLLLPATPMATESAEAKAPLLPLPDKPSIAVLPFQNMSGDPAQEYFADGMVEDIITALSRFKSLFVIARNSSFSYKGKAVDGRRVGRELGVRYVLEGSVRKDGDKVRITGQLIECETGAHLWADRIDGSLEDVFALQDQVAVRVVGAVAPTIGWTEIQRARRKPAGSLDAYDLALRGVALGRDGTKESIEQALRLFDRAMELAPNYAAPYGMAAACYGVRKGQGWVTDEEAERAEVRRLAGRVSEIGNDDDLAQCLAGHAMAWVCHEVEIGAAMIDKALLINPNSARGWAERAFVGLALRAHETVIDDASRALRLSPQDSRRWFAETMMAYALLFLGRYGEASVWATRGLSHITNIPLLLVAASAHALAGADEKARSVAATLHGRNPALRLSQLAYYFSLRPPDLQGMVEGLRLAGVPE